MLSTRLITGPLLIIAAIGLLWLDEWAVTLELGHTAMPRGIILLLLCLLVAAFAAVELSLLAAASGRRPAVGLVIAGSWALLLTIWSNTPDSADGTIGWPMCVIAAAWFGSLVVHTRGQRTEGVFADAAASTATIVYIGGFLGFYLLLRQDVSAWWILAVVLITKSCDIGAYFTGMSIGRRKLIPWLSPGKTVEGFVGGIVLAMIVALLANWLLAGEGYTALSTGMALLLGLLLAVFGQAGDLCMSLLKRDAGIKDSSAILPGMGGVMDVLDSLLLVAPIAWLLLAA
ncbi:MAG: CDP-archaeol synthase [Phycisphaerales bacterium]|jgi:phosphatidate cytidylyltransferase|nr:CDP-archaeol synthase [Phycisphaerales bacterium]